ncbi:MAG: hypothetical protein COA57_04560 [Flavobacteriales bacterium]|nr:MAG: hypothetical protein COA57_04560 [Flavobacteriales bacterium]
MPQSILVVDDEPLNRQVIIDMLKEADGQYSILSANNGKIACEITTRLLPDAILMDWNMPEMNGIEALKFLKSQQKTKNIPILMVTSITASEKLEEAFETGATDYITKPVKKTELLARVRSVLKASAYQQEILNQKEEIERQKLDITDSIIYAQKIQEGTLPKRSVMYDILDSFVLFKPRDIVSGDFYWFYQKSSPPPQPNDLVHPDITEVPPKEMGENSPPRPKKVERELIFIAACDCTGHGVPGAFVSMIGNMLLNQAIIEKGLEKPGEILSEINKGMKAVFTREDDKQHISDGMDMTLCVFDKDFKTLEFAGAQNPMYFVRQGGLIVTGGDKRPIGGRTESDYRFLNHTFELEKGDTIYIFSDGYADQFGGPKGKKLKQIGFKQILLEVKGKTMKEQKEILDKKIQAWKGDLEQVDDMLLIGIRI